MCLETMKRGEVGSEKCGLGWWVGEGGVVGFGVLIRQI